MNFKPNEFFIGLVEFITILLPGAVLALIVLLVEKNHPVQDNHPFYQYAFSDNTNMIFWMVIIFSSFGLGYFLSSIASGLDLLYDGIRKQYCPYDEDLSEKFDKIYSLKQKEEYLRIYNESSIEIKKEQSEEDIILKLKEKEKEKLFEEYKIKFKNNYLRKLLAFIFKLNFKIEIDGSNEEVKKIMNSQPKAVRNATNAYKWAGTILEAHYPAISEQATRIMSASKFFRSMVLVSLLFLLLQIFSQISFFCWKIPSSFWQINLFILVLSFREYIIQRQKSVQKTYQSIVTLTYFNKVDKDQ